MDDLIVQRSNVFLLSSDVYPPGVRAEDFDVAVKAYKDAITTGIKADTFPIPHIDTITAHCTLAARRNILIEAASGPSDVDDIVDAAQELMDSYLELQSWNDWIDVKNALRAANLCYTEHDDDTEDEIYYQINNSPQFNMIESHKNKRYEDSFVSYKVLPADEAYDYDELCSSISCDTYFFDFDELLDGGV